jgi:hypothetical protein
MKRSSILSLFLVLVMSGCASSSSHTQKEMPKGPYYEGNAGKNIHFAVLEPKGVNLSSNEHWLLPLAQGTLTSDFKIFSAMNVLDRQNLDKILENQQLGTSGNFSDEDYVRIGHLINAQYILVGTITKVPNNTYLVNFSISDSSTGEIKASFPPTSCTINQLQDTSILKNVSETLLEQMGVTLTVAGKSALHIRNTNSIGAETALAKGIIAQKGGNVGQSLSYYYNAVAFEPSLAEVRGRLSIVSNNVSTGNIGENARNLIAYRNAWKKTLDECDVFLEEHFPFEIIYDSKISQSSGINYYRESVDLKIEIQVKPTELFNMIQDVQRGLNKTGKKDEWGFGTWPFNQDKKLLEYYSDLLNNPDSINQKILLNQPASSFEPVDKPSGSAGGNALSNAKADFFSYSILSTSVIPYGKKMNVNMALINGEGETISTISANIFGQAGTLTQEQRYYYREVHNEIVSTISVKPIIKKFSLVFTGVDVNKITDNTTVKIISVNGKDAETTGQTGYIKITVGRF